MRGVCAPGTGSLVHRTLRTIATCVPVLAIAAGLGACTEPHVAETKAEVSHQTAVMHGAIHNYWECGFILHTWSQYKCYSFCRSRRGYV
jgi:hypothetical protein